MTAKKIDIGSSHEIIANIGSIEEQMLTHEQAECSVKHYFGAGVYVREVSIPAGTFAIGHHQNFDHMNHFVKGRVIVLNEDGSTAELVAPMVFVGKPGRKIGLIVEDMVWLNIYPTDETDVDVLEDMFLTKSDGWKANNRMIFDESVLLHHKDRDDYRAMLKEAGVSHETALSQSLEKSDQVPMPLDSGHKMKVSDSPIEGLGVFATAAIDSGEIIAIARIGGMRTPAGRYTNHSVNPNAEMVGSPNGDINLVAIKKINGCTGGADGDEITVDYRQARNEAMKLSGNTLCLQ